MNVIISHPTSNEVNRALVSALSKRELLFAYYTAIASFPGSMLDALGAIGLLSEIRRRRFDPVLRNYTHISPWVESGRLLSMKMGFAKLIEHETGTFCVDAVYRSMDKKVASVLKRSAKRGAKAVYAYEDGAVHSFRAAKCYGLSCFYDLPIGYWRTAKRLLEKERERWPEWASTLTGLQDSEAKLARKDEELQLADLIFVASQFSANTLKDFPGALADIKVVPYGFPPVAENRNYSKANGPLKLLFVGGLSQRKGIADLFAATEALGAHVELTVVGQKASNSCSALDGVLTKHRWIPSLSHAKILKLMKLHDVLIFPSLFEGFGLVITEAMSQGTPVITTDRTAGPDLIRHGENGWIIEAGSTEALKAAIEEILYAPEVIRQAGCEAMETARKRPWDVYGKELVEAIAGKDPVNRTDRNNTRIL